MCAGFGILTEKSENAIVFIKYARKGNGIVRMINKNLEEISDGKVYGLHDMVRAACNDCEGCHSCCEDMGDSIILDPLDVYLLQKVSATSCRTEEREYGGKSQHETLYANRSGSSERPGSSAGRCPG